MSEPSLPHALTRRDFLIGGVAATAAACSSGDSTAGSESSGAPASSAAETTTTAAPTTTTTALQPLPAPDYAGADPFGFGVASGDPDDVSIVLWTRLDPGDSPLSADQDVVVDVAGDADFAELVSSTVVTARVEHGHSVHAIADGLQPDSWYHYRFRVGDHVSTTGRTRTAPSAGESVDRLRVGVSSCQNWELGTFVAHRHLAESELDLFVFLGDYVYEYAPNEPTVTTSAGPRIHDGPEPRDLDDYRRRYSQYRRDPDLQAHHAAHPWLVVWDDHEVDNNYAGLVPAGGEPSDAFAARRHDAYRVWWEFTPVRTGPPTPDGLRIHRTVGWGDLADIHMLDGRQYRDPQPTDGEPVDIPGAGDLGARALGPTALDPDHTMLGSEQEVWFVGQVSSSSARWQLVGNQVMMHGIKAFPGDVPVTPTDTWDGYHASREQLLERLADASNLVVLTGDFHSATIADLRSDPFDLARPIVGAELMAPAISSQFVEALRPIAPLALSINPQVRHFDPENGYIVCTVDTDKVIAELFIVDDVTDERSGVEMTARATIIAGTPGIESVELIPG